MTIADSVGLAALGWGFPLKATEELESAFSIVHKAMCRARFPIQEKRVREIFDEYWGRSLKEH